MPETASFDANAEVIRVRSYGGAAITDLYGSLEEVLELSELHNCRRVPVDTREQVWCSTDAEAFYFFSQLPHYLRVADIVPRRDGNTARRRFTENVAVNRGLLYRYFYLENNALEWLHTNVS